MAKPSGVTARPECMRCRIRYAPVDCRSPVSCKTSRRSRRSTQADLVDMKTPSYPAEPKSDLPLPGSERTLPRSVRSKYHARSRDRWIEIDKLPWFEPNPGTRAECFGLRSSTTDRVMSEIVRRVDRPGNCYPRPRGPTILYRPTSPLRLPDVPI